MAKKIRFGQDLNLGDSGHTTSHWTTYKIIIEPENESVVIQLMGYKDTTHRENGGNSDGACEMFQAINNDVIDEVIVDNYDKFMRSGLEQKIVNAVRAHIKNNDKNKKFENSTDESNR